VTATQLGWLQDEATMNDALRAAVFARDKAICSFSGLSVWYLDHGTAPFSHADWVDHVKPKSRGGKDTLDNLVCASYFYNSKKLNNGSDCQYLFSKGQPTETFFSTHGELSPQQALLLTRHRKIEVSDWYFNRAVFNIMVAIENELLKAEPVRDRDYWLRSARKRIEVWKKLTRGTASFQSRGLVQFPEAEDVQLMQSLCNTSDSQWEKNYKQLLRWTRCNERTLNRFVKAKCGQNRERVILDAVARKTATPPLINALRRNADLL
jgi:hypothetical protein